MEGHSSNLAQPLSEGKQSTTDQPYRNPSHDVAAVTPSAPGQSLAAFAPGQSLASSAPGQSLAPAPPGQYVIAVAQPIAVGLAPMQAPRDANGIQLGAWDSGLCDCADSSNNCLMSFFCPCFQLAGIAARIGVFKYERVVGFTAVCFLLFWCGPFAFVGAIGLVACMMVLRQRTRKFFHIPGSDCDDCCVATFCSPCVIAQLATHVHSYSAGDGCSFSSPTLLPGLPPTQQPQIAIVCSQPQSSNHLPQATAGDCLPQASAEGHAISQNNPAKVEV
jgi:Cys-rich protein (TIGR01571 family)